MTFLAGKELAKLVESKGWTLPRINGSHHIYSKPGVRVRLSIPTHGSTKLQLELQRHVMKLAGPPSTDRADLLRYRSAGSAAARAAGKGIR